MKEGPTVAVLQSPSTCVPDLPQILCRVPDILLMSTRVLRHLSLSGYERGGFMKRGLLGTLIGSSRMFDLGFERGFIERRFQFRQV